MAENQPNGINPEAPAPVQQEAEKTKELFNKEKAGLQAALLMDGKKDTSENTIKALTTIKASSESPNLEKITKSSKFERDNYWKDKEKKAGREIAFDDKKTEWTANADQIFNAFRGNPEQKGLLVKLGYDQGKSAKDFYDEFFVEGKGNLGFFGKRIAESFSEEDLSSAQKKSLTISETNPDGSISTKEISLLEALGSFYGKNSTEIARLVTEGMFNLKNNEEEFKKAAGLQINNLSDDDKAYLEAINSNYQEWDKREKARLDEEKRKREEARKKAEEEAKNNSVEGLTKRATEIYDRLDNTGTEIMKHFKPILESYKTKPDGISDEVFVNNARAVVEAFTKAESMTSKSDESQLLTIISILDTLQNTDFDKLSDPEKEFYKKTQSDVAQKLAEKGVRPIDPQKYLEEKKEKAKITEVEAKENEEEGYALALGGYTRNGNVIREPEYTLKKKKTDRTGQVEVEPVNASTEEISRNIKELSERIGNGNNEFIKHFLPVLKSYEQKPADFSDELYRLTTQHLLTTVKSVEMASDKSEKDQALLLINYLDMLSLDKATRKDLAPKDSALIEEKEAEFIKLLADKNIKPITVNIGETYDPDKMDVSSRDVVDNDEDVNRITKVHFRRGFAMGDEVIRKPRVRYGVKRQTQAEAVESTQAEGSEQKPAEPAQAEQVKPVHAGDNVQKDADKSGSDQPQPEQAQPAQKEANEPAGSAQPTEGETGRDVKTDEPEQKTKPSQEDIDKQLGQAKLLAGRELTEEEKDRIRNGEPAESVIKNDGLTSTSPGNDN